MSPVPSPLSWARTFVVRYCFMEVSYAGSKRAEPDGGRSDGGEGEAARKTRRMDDASGAPEIPELASAEDPFELGDHPPLHAWARVTYADVRVAVGHGQPLRRKLPSGKVAPMFKRCKKMKDEAIPALNDERTLNIPGCKGIIVAQDLTRVTRDWCGNVVIEDMKGAKCYYVTTMPHLEHMLCSDRWRNERYFYECTPINRPLHLFADLDPKMDTDTSWFATIPEFEEFMVEALAEFEQFICERLGVEASAVHVSVCESNRAGRASWHITWEVEGRMFRDFRSVGAFMRSFEYYAILKAGDRSVYDETNRWYTQKKDGGLPEWIVDMTVYNINRCFRTLYSTKAKHASSGGHYMNPCRIPAGLYTAGGTDGCSERVARIRAQSMIFPVFGQPDDELYIVNWPEPGDACLPAHSTNGTHWHWPLGSVPEHAYPLMSKRWHHPPEGFTRFKVRRARLGGGSGDGSGSSRSGRRVMEANSATAKQFQLDPALIKRLIDTVPDLWKACVKDMANRTCRGGEESSEHRAIMARGRTANMDVEYVPDTNSLHVDHRTHMCPQRSASTQGKTHAHDNNQTYLYVHEERGDDEGEGEGVRSRGVCLNWLCFGTTHEVGADLRAREASKAMAGRYILHGKEAHATAEAFMAVRQACQVRPAAVLSALMRNLGMGGE